jgi:hypothetical protein
MFKNKIVLETNNILQQSYLLTYNSNSVLSIHILKDLFSLKNVKKNKYAQYSVQYTQFTHNLIQFK